MRAVLRISSGVRRRDLRVEDLRGEARDAYRIWHDFVGLSEASALDLVRADGLVEESGVDGSGVHGSGVDGLAGPLGNIFGLSEAAARVASRGRGSVSEVAVRSSAGPEPGDAWKLVAKIEEFASDLCRRGVPEEKALREAAFALFEAAPDSLQDWVAAVADRRWPRLWGRSRSTSGSKDTFSGRTSGTVRR
jgi:hypothetical protein